jgi:hypothetical protein
MTNPYTCNEWHLRIGNQLMDITIRQDDQYPQLWRIHYRGTVSDMVNLPRAKEAALSWVRPRGLGGSETAKWTIGKSQREPATAGFKEAAE